MIKIICNFFLIFTLVSYIVEAQTFKELEAIILAEPDVQSKLATLDKVQSSFINASLKQQASFWHLLALVQQQNSLFQASIDSATHSISLIKKNSTRQDLLLARNYILRSNSIYKIDSSTLNYCDDIEKAIKLLTDLRSEPSKLATALSSQSRCIYEKTNNIPEALAILDKAIFIAQNNQLKNEEQATIYNETALIYRRLSIFDKAYQYNIIAKNKWLLAGDYQGVYFMIKNSIVSATDMTKYEIAQQHIDELLLFAQQHPEFKDLPFYANYHSAVLARAQDNWQLAIVFFEKTIALEALASNSAYIRAAYEQLALMYFRNNQTSKSFDVLAMLESQYPGLPSVKAEVSPLILMKTGRKLTALNTAYKLLEQAKSEKREFVQKSTATLAQVHDNNLKQLDNMLLKQRFNYLAIISLLFVVLLILFSYIQVKRRKILKQEKDVAALLLTKKNQLLADVSHELGTPLSVLKLQVESLKDDLETDVQLSYDALDNKLNDIEHLIDDIHQLAQSDIGGLTLNYEMFNANQVFSHWQREFEHFGEINQLRFRMKNGLPDDFFIKIDRDKIKQVITNLLANSQKYTDKPGKIDFAIFIKNNNLCITIEDSVPGVSNEELTHIFDRLYRVESSRSRDTGGSGLGLAICKSLIEAHKGEIYAQQSNLGGLKIIIKIPVQPFHRVN